MDDAYRDGIDPRSWNLDGLRKRQEAEDSARLDQKPRCFSRTAAEIALPHEIRSALSRHGSHPCEWEPITAANELYGLRAGDRIQLFEKTRKGWVPIKALNGVRSGQQVLAFRSRRPRRHTNYLGDSERSLAEQLSYDAVVQRVFHNRDLIAHVEKHGFPSKEAMLRRLNRRSLKEMSQTLDNVERIESPQYWICLNLRDADGQPAAGYTYQLRDSSGAERGGKLDNQGEARVVNLADGPVEVSFGEPIDEQEIAAQRQAIKQALDTVLQAERAEAAHIEAEFQQKNLLGKLSTLENARARGARNAAWGMLTGIKELSDLVTQQVNHALSAAWESWRYSDEGHYANQFAQRFVDAQFQELADVLGFDPRSLTREQWAEALSLANFIWHDTETRQLLIDFAQDYIDAQHFLEVTETVSGLATEFAFELAVTILTLGAGATVAVAIKARHLSKLKGLGSQFRKLAQRLKQRAGSKQGTGRTGQWHYQTLEKPESRGIEKSVVDENSASQSPVDSTVMWGDNSGPDNSASSPNSISKHGADSTKYLRAIDPDLVDDAILRKQSNKDFDVLTDDEFIALHAYTSEHYASINHLMRSGSIDGTPWESLAKSADAALVKLSSVDGRVYPGSVYRGITKMDDSTINLLFEEGEIFSDPAFVSASSKPAGSFGGDVEMVITSKSGVDVSDASAFPYESEVLFRPESKFKVISKTQSSSGKWIIEMIEI